MYGYKEKVKFHNNQSNRKVYNKLSDYLGMNEIPNPERAIYHYKVRVITESYFNDGLMEVYGKSRSRRLPIWEFRSWVLLENYNRIGPDKADKLMMKTSNEELREISDILSNLLTEMKTSTIKMEEEIRKMLKESSRNFIRIPVKVILQYIALNMNCEDNCKYEIVENEGKIYLKFTIYRTGNKYASPIEFTGRKFKVNAVFKLTKKQTNS